jgi:hypothetical protein
MKMAFDIIFRTEDHGSGGLSCERWSAIDDRTYDGAPDGHGMIGWGATEQEAKDDLVRLFQEEAEAQEKYFSGVMPHAGD